MPYRSKPVTIEKRPTIERRKTFGERVVRRVKNLAAGAGLLYSVTFARPPPIRREVESMRVNDLNDRRDNKREPNHVKFVAVNQQVQRIDKVAVDASFTRVGNEEIINVSFEDGSSVRAVLKVDSVRAIYARNGPVDKRISRGDATVYLKEYGRITGVVTVPGGRGGRGRNDPPVDKLIFQASTGECLVIEVEPGSIKRVEINDPRFNSDN